MERSRVIAAADILDDVARAEAAYGTNEAPYFLLLLAAHFATQRDRAEVLAALLELHGRNPAQEGCLRAIAGLHRATRGGIEVYVPDLPARMRKDALRGRVRDTLDIGVDRFAARIDRRFRTERDSLPAFARSAWC